jgi:hypothetical protein
LSRSACCFLYGRGFVAAMGREFYGAVAGDPEMGVPYSECEKMCHFFAHLSRERFGKFPDTDSGICRVIALRGPADRHGDSPLRAGTSAAQIVVI